jgi:alkylhydroperoxidase/carboxymuconolactone decarboxylase family protein YurZ
MGRLVGTFNALLLDPPVGGALQAVGAAIRFNGALADRERELVILAVARAESSPYEWQAHVRQAAKYGVTDGEIACIGLPASEWAGTESEVVCLNAARDLLRDGDLSVEVFDQAVSVIGLPKLFDVVSVVGYYRLTALSLRVWRVPPRSRPADEVPA